MQSLKVFCASEYERPQNYNERYLTIDLMAEQKSRLLNSEYIDFIDKCLEKTGISRKENRKDISCLELGCGSGPLGAYLLEQEYSVDFSDFSSNCVQRLKNEFGYNAFTADCRNIKCVADNTYDIILLSGTVQETDNYEDAKKIYTEINRILKQGGIFIHFQGSYLNPAKKILCSYLAQNISWYLNPAKVLRRNTFVRKLFKKKPVKKSVHYLLYHPEATKKWLLNSNFKCECEPEIFRFEYGLINLPFFIGPLLELLIVKNSPKEADIDITDVYFSAREEVLSKLGFLLTNITRKYLKKYFGSSIGFCMKKL